jgi:hypothetical protein
VRLGVVVGLVWVVMSCGAHPAEEVPGMWGTADTSSPESIEWPADWHGDRCISCQWLHRYLVDSTWKLGEGAAQGEDIFASYFWWGSTEPLPEGTKILIEGDFPYARYFNLQVSPPWHPQYPDWRSGRGAPEIPLIDVDIVPDPDHTNPYLPGADRYAENRHYHVTFELRSGNPVELNPKAGVPPYRAPGNLRFGGHRSGQHGEFGPYVGIRIYAPDNFDPLAGVELPVVRVQFPGKDPVLAPPVADPYWSALRNPDDWPEPILDPEMNPCLDGGLSKVAASLVTMRRAFISEVVGELPPFGQVGATGRLTGNRDFNTLPDGSLRMFKVFGWPRNILASQRGGEYAVRYDREVFHRGADVPPPGNDEHVSGTDMHNSFVKTKVFLEPGVVVLIQAKAPRIPRTLHRDRVMGASDQLRYWSLNFVSQLRGTPIVAGGVLDEMVVLDTNGDYTIVVGRAEDRPTNATADNGFTWTPVRLSTINLMFRFKSTAEKTWSRALQNVSWAEGDFLLPTYDPNALKRVMGDSLPSVRYSTKEQVEKMGSVGTAPYQIPPDELLPENYLVH